MAGKRARSDKSVLSRQSIANRRRALSEQRVSTSGHGRRALVGLSLLAASSLALLSVASYDARDRVGPGFKNWVGPVGHAIGEALRGLVGIVAYVPAAAGVYVALIVLVGSRERRRWPQAVSLLLLCVSGSVMAQLFLQHQPGWAHAPGGLLGQSLAGLLTGLFSTVGTLVLVTALSVAAAIVGTQFVFLRLCAFAWRALVATADKAWEWAATFWAARKEAWASRREAAAKARAEEEAFLQRLEAEEAALSEAEREAREAEAMADEALRLARAAEEAKLQKQREKVLAKAERERRIAEKAAERAARAARKLGIDDEVPTDPPYPPQLEAVDAAFGVAPTVISAQRPEVMGLAGDPAWAMELLPPPPPTSKIDLPPQPPARRDKEPQRQPNIVMPPPPPAAAFNSLPPQAAAAPTDPPPTARPSTAEQVTVPPPSTSAEQVTVPPPTQLSRQPVIVEPKAPPKPTKKRAAESFEFVGDRKSFTLPSIDLLESDRAVRSQLDKDAYLATAEKLRAKLADFGIEGQVVEIRPGPVVTMYEFQPGPGIKISRIASLADDLAMAMEAMRVRIVAPIPGKGVVGIEVPNRDRETVYLKEIAEQDAFQKSSSRLTMCLGKDIEGMPYVLDLAKAPHLLMAGTTGSGKSVAVNAMIMSILLKSTPEEVRFLMVDPKMLELSVYEGIPHLLLPVVTDPKKAAMALRWAVEEMERRYQLLADVGVRNITGYNKLVEAKHAEKKGSTGTSPREAVIEAKPQPAPARPAAESKAAEQAKPPEGKRRKLLIVDVAEGESEEDALKRAEQKPSELGVAAPVEPLEEAREQVELVPEVKAEVLEAKTEAEIRVDDATLAANEAAQAAQAAAEPAEEEPPELKKLPYIVVIIDELADLMMVASREVETYIARLAQMARAAGIHLMTATQRPSTDVVTGVIKANFPTRISFQLRSKPDSMTILGTIGAEALLGMGDMLIMPPTSAHLQRVHGAFVSETEIKRVVDMLKAQGKPVYDDNILKPRDEELEGGGEEDELSDELYDQALAIVAEMRTVSISMLQRKMRIGYNRAARMIERMERDGVVGAADGAKPREVLLRPVGEMPGAGAV